VGQTRLVFHAWKLDGAEAPEMVGHKLSIQQAKAAPPQPFDQVNQGDFAAIRSPTKHTFPSKEAATLACLDRRIAELVQQLEVIAAQPQPATMRLRKMLQLRIRFLHNVSRHRHQVNDEIYGQLRPLYMPRRERYLARESRVFQRVLDDGAVQGEFRVERAAGVARLLLMATNAFLPFALSPQQLRRPKQITAQADKLIDLLLRGLSVARTICPGLKENKEC
jgi:AcrR family transcriptional regulator